MSYETNPIGGQHSSAVSVLSATIKTSRSQVTTDITSVLSEISIFENLNRPYLSGYITIVDSERVLEMIDIQGAEEIEIVFKRNTDFKNVKQIKINFIIQRIEKIIKTNDFTQVVSFKVIDKEAFKSALHDVNRVYEGQPYQIIDKVLKEFLDRDDLKTSAIDNVTDSMKVIVPHMTPLETCRWIRNRSINQNGYPYYFYKTAMTNEYIFADLETLLTAQVINEDQPFTDNGNTGSSETTAKNFLIHKMSQAEVDDLFSMVREGVVGSSQRYYDVTKGDFEQVEFNINNDLLVDLEDLNTNQSRALIDGRLAYDDVAISNYQSKVQSQIAAAHVFDYSKSYDEPRDIGENRKKIRAHALKHLMDKTPLKIVVDTDEFINGDEHYGVGNNIRVIIRSKQEMDNAARIDQRQSGDYLIMAANYVIKMDQSNRFQATLLCAKVANYNSDSYYSGKGVR